MTIFLVTYIVLGLLIAICKIKESIKLENYIGSISERDLVKHYGYDEKVNYITFITVVIFPSIVFIHGYLQFVKIVNNRIYGN